VEKWIFKMVYSSADHPSEWSRGHRLEDQARMREQALADDLVWLEMSREQYLAASSHPIFFEVLRLAILADPHISFWMAQYKWLGLEGQTITTDGQVKVEFHHNTFAEERSLWLKFME
jgi:hypothetical protein